MQLWMYNNPKNTRTQKLSFIQNRVKLNGPAKSQLFLKISKEKYFMHLTLYDLIFQTYKNLNFFISLEHPKSNTVNKYRITCQHTVYEYWLRCKQIIYKEGLLLKNSKPTIVLVTLIMI